MCTENTTLNPFVKKSILYWLIIYSPAYIGLVIFWWFNGSVYTHMYGDFETDFLEFSFVLQSLFIFLVIAISKLWRFVWMIVWGPIVLLILSILVSFLVAFIFAPHIYDQYLFVIYTIVNWLFSGLAVFMAARGASK